VALPACQGTEPGDGSPDLPELVYAERDEGTGLWSIQGYTEEGGSDELAPGPDGVPRPSATGLRVRPTTGELLYRSEDPGYLGYLLLLIAYYKQEDFQLIMANADGTGARALFAPITPGHLPAKLVSVG
jgi:hypothetical protein